MKKSLIISLLAVLAAVSGAQAGSAAPANGRAVAENREMPRTKTFSHNTEAASKAGSNVAEAYIQPLDGEWQAKQAGANIKSFTCNFSVPFLWVDREIFLYIGGTSGAYTIYINGEQAGTSPHGTAPLEFDITKYAKEGANKLTIEISKDMLNGGQSSGEPRLTGEVVVHAQPRIRIRDFSAKTVFNADNNGANVELGIAVKTHLLNKKQVRLYYSLLDPSGGEVSGGHRDVELDMRREETVRFLADIANAKPWSHEKPDMYTLLLKLQHEGRYTEYVAYRFGLRTVTTDGGRLLINGYPIALGIAEYAVSGSREQTEEELRAIKRSGYNMIKVKGCPQPGYMYDLCDRIGLYICDQAGINTASYGDSRKREGGNPSNDPAYELLFRDRVESMYRTSQNHPSVVMFSLAEKSANGYNLYESYLALKRLEPSRPVIYMDAGGEWNTDAIDSKLRENHPNAVGGRLTLNIGTPASKEAGAGGISPEITTDGDGVYRISNRATSTLLVGELAYTVRQGSKKVTEGMIPVEIAPQETKIFTIPNGKSKPGTRLKYDISLRSNLN